MKILLNKFLLQSLLLVGSCLLLVSQAAAESGRVKFAIPAESAERSLKQFSEQSGLDVLFITQTAADVVTRPVEGEFAPKEAMDLLLLGTPLAATQDENTGAMKVVRTAPEPPKSAAPRNGARSPSSDPIAVLDKLVVTGSNIPTAADAAAVPVTVIGKQQIDDTGLNSNLLEVLRKRLPSLAGRNNVGNSNGNNVSQITFGGSSIALRNLDTLVLINGERVTTNGANGIRGKNFVDVNQIPAAAIDRVEVLTDGASAIYGSDAVGGVVNFILKSNYQGAEFGGRYAVAPADGHYSERSGYVVAGAGEKGFNLTISGSWSRTDPLYDNQRPFSRVLTGKTAIVPGAVGQGTTFPTALLNPSLNSPSQVNPVGLNAAAPNLAALITNGTYAPATSTSVAATFDSAPYTTLLMQQDQKGLVASASDEIFGKRLVAYGDAIWASTDSFWQVPAQTNTVTEPAGAPYDPLTTAFPQVAFADLAAPVGYNASAHSIWASGGLRGNFADCWNWEANYTYNQNSIDQHERGVYYKPNLTRALAGGYDAAGNVVAGGAYSRVATGYAETEAFTIQPALDPFARSGGFNPAALDNVLGTALLQVGGKLESAQFKLEGEPSEIPAGRIGAAAGFATRQEQITGNPDPNSLYSGPSGQNWIGGSFFDPFDSTRRVNSGFAEIRVPITGPTWNLSGLHALDANAAYRIEDYSDAGLSKVPKYGLRWQPFDEQMTFRATYANSFTAPGLYFLFGPSSQSVLAASTLKSALGFTGQPQLLSTGNPNLKPSTAITRSAGVVLSPRVIKGLTVSVDYFKADERGIPGGLGTGVMLSSVDRLGPASPSVGNMTFNNFAGRPGAQTVTTPGQLTSYLQGGGNASNIYLTTYFINLSEIQVETVDVSAEYELPTESYGRFDLSTAGTFFTSYKFQALPDQPLYQYSGYSTNGGSGNQGTVPSYRFYSTLDWQFHRFGVTIGNTYVPAVTDIGTGGNTFATSTTLKPIPVDRYITWDFQLSYTTNPTDARAMWRWLRGTKFSIGVNNVFNRMPPLSAQAFTDANADTAYYNPIGRLIFGAVNVKF